MRLKKKKGRVVMPGEETTAKVGEALINKLQMQGLKVEGAPQDGDSSMMDQSTWTYYSEATMNADASQNPAEISMSTADINIGAELEKIDLEESKVSKMKKDSKKDPTQKVDMNSPPMQDLKLDIEKAKKGMQDKLGTDRKSTVESPAADETSAAERLKDSVRQSTPKTKQDLEAKTEQTPGKKDDTTVTPQDAKVESVKDTAQVIKPGDVSSPDKDDLRKPIETPEKAAAATQQEPKKEETPVDTKETTAQQNVTGPPEQSAPTPVEQAKVEPVTQEKPVETKPVETQPVEEKPVETKPAEVKPVETKPAEVKVETPAEPVAKEEPVKEETPKEAEPVQKEQQKTETVVNTPQEDPTPVVEDTTQSEVKMIDTSVPKEEVEPEVAVNIQKETEPLVMKEEEPLVEEASGGSNTLLYVGLAVGVAAAGALAFMLTRPKKQ